MLCGVKELMVSTGSLAGGQNLQRRSTPPSSVTHRQVTFSAGVKSFTRFISPAVRLSLPSTEIDMRFVKE